MARGKVFLRFPDGGEMYAKTDLTGHGNVNEGEEFIARELWHFGRGQLMKDGRKLRVRVRSVERVNRSFHLLHVDILEDLSPKNATPGSLF